MKKEKERLTVYDRPFEKLPCGCIYYPSFTEGQWVDNFGKGPRQWQSGTHYQSYTDSYLCTEGHNE